MPKLTALRRRQALELLASCPDGCSTALMNLHKLDAVELAELVKTGLATTHVQWMVSGSRRFEVTRLRITEEGRSALAMPPGGRKT